MRHKGQILPWALAAAATLTLLGQGEGEARNFRAAQIPNGDNCLACHVFPGGPRTPMGLQVEAKLTTQAAMMGVGINTLSVNWQDYFSLDADGDGYTNGQELGDTAGTWTPGPADPTLRSDPNNVADVPNGLEPLCTESPEVTCDEVDNDCDGLIDEELTNACGECGPVPAETCNGMDDDCDGLIDEGLNCTSPSFSSFGFDEASIMADGMDTQTVRLTLANAGNVDEVRFIVNRAGQSENGRSYDGYFRVRRDGMSWVCEEIGVGLGNDKLVLQSSPCESNMDLNGNVEFVASFAMDLSFGAAMNNQISATWYVGGVLQTGWRQVTQSGMGFNVTVPPPRPLGLRTFTFDKPSVASDGVETQVFRLTLDGAASITEARFLINRSGQSENGRVTDGYFRVRKDGMVWVCEEITTGSGNNKINVQSVGCAANASPDGSVTYVIPVKIEPAFGVANNNQVSGIWYIGATAQGSWRKLTGTGMGFNVVTPPLGLGGFTMGKTSIVANNTDTQTFNLTLNGASAITEVRFLINRSGQSENGRINDGYFRARKDGMSWVCEEIGAGTGNNRIIVAESGCAPVAQSNGAQTWSLSFAADRFFGAAMNNQVSALWLIDGTAQTGWRKVTQPGMGFNVTLPVVAAGTFESFSFDMDEVANDGEEVQTFRARLQNALTVTDLRFLVNRSGQAENGRLNDGYIRVQFDGTTATCSEFGTGSGNVNIDVLEDQCEVTINPDNSVDYAISYVILPGIPASTNHQVSAIWYAGGTALTSWRRVSVSGEGFDVVEPSPSFQSFSFDAAEVANDDMEVQTLRLTLKAGVNADDVRVLINRAGQSENGLSNTGYFQFSYDPMTMTWSCAELTTGLGNANVTLLTEMCEANADMNGAVEFVFPFSVGGGFTPAMDNQVSALWFTGGVAQTSWRRVTEPGMGFTVSAP